MWFDEARVETAVEFTPTWLAITLLFVGYLGSVYVIGPSVAVAYAKGASWKSATWPGIVIGAYGSFVALKAVFFVERPPIEPPFPAETFPVVLRPLYYLSVGFETGAFPSGHAVAATVFWGLVVVDLELRSFPERLVAGVVLVAALASSRVVLGVHYVADVVGGVALGLAVLGVMLVVRRRAENPANATLAVAAVPTLAGFAVGAPIQSGALLSVLVGVYLLNTYTDIVSTDRLTGHPSTGELDSDRRVDGD